MTTGERPPVDPSSVPEIGLLPKPAVSNTATGTVDSDEMGAYSQALQGNGEQAGITATSATPEDDMPLYSQALRAHGERYGVRADQTEFDSLPPYSQALKLNGEKNGIKVKDTPEAARIPKTAAPEEPKQKATEPAADEMLHYARPLPPGSEIVENPQQAQQAQEALVEPEPGGVRGLLRGLRRKVKSVIKNLYGVDKAGDRYQAELERIPDADAFNILNGEVGKWRARQHVRPLGLKEREYLHRAEAQLDIASKAQIAVAIDTARREWVAQDRPGLRREFLLDAAREAQAKMIRQRQEAEYLHLIDTKFGSAMLWMQRQSGAKKFAAGAAFGLVIGAGGIFTGGGLLGAGLALGGARAFRTFFMRRSSQLGGAYAENEINDAAARLGELREDKPRQSKPAEYADDVLTATTGARATETARVKKNVRHTYAIAGAGVAVGALAHTEQVHELAGGVVNWVQAKLDHAPIIGHFINGDSVKTVGGHAMPKPSGQHVGDAFPKPGVDKPIDGIFPKPGEGYPRFDTVAAAHDQALKGIPADTHLTAELARHMNSHQQAAFNGLSDEGKRFWLSLNGGAQVNGMEYLDQVA